jgi:hypothetical protein
MNQALKRKEYVYRGAGFPVTLIDFPTRKAAGEEILDVDTEKLDLAIACLVLMKPAFLTGKEIRFLRHLLSESLAVFGNHFDLSAAGIKKWEDLDDTSINSVTNDFAIRNYVAKRLAFRFETTIDFAVHRSILEASEFWRPERVEIPFEALARFTKVREVAFRKHP